jgi:hypothetical protein
MLGGVDYLGRMKSLHYAVKVLITGNVVSSGKRLDSPRVSQEPIPTLS